MQSPNRSRAVLLILGVGALAGVVAARLIWLQVAASDDHRTKAARQQQQIVEMRGRRGALLDRFGRELAVSVTTESLYAHPGRIENARHVARTLAPVLGVSSARLEKELVSAASFRWLARRLEPGVASAVRALSIPVGPGEALDFQEEPKRRYPQGLLAVHAVGFTDIDQKGLEGVESRLDDVLEGATSLYLAQRDGRGGHVLQMVRPPLRHARDVVLTLDLVLQHQVERALDEAMRESGARAAMAILLDPSTGQILALANRPTFEPDRAGKSDPSHRRNRVVTDLYEPGSTFKAITAAIAIDEGRVSPETRYDCAPIRIHGKTYRDVHEHGVLSVREILEQSSNVGIIQVGGTLSKEVLRDRILRFGFGQKTGVEFPGEVEGRVTTLEDMSGLSSISMSMGYEIQVTALQIAAAMAAIANDGVWNAPRVILGTRGADGTFEPAPPADSRRVISSRTAVTLANILEGVVVRGTGTRAAVPGYRVAGKTGTSRKLGPDGRYSTREYMASFAGFAPVSSPRLAGVVVLDTPRGGSYYGGLTAAPVLGTVFGEALVHLGIAPDSDPWAAVDEALAATAETRPGTQGKRKDEFFDGDGASDTEVSQPGPGEVPVLAGMTLREATRTLASAGFTVRPEGHGKVHAQEPAAGTPLAAGSPVRIRLDHRTGEDGAALVAWSEGRGR